MTSRVRLRVIVVLLSFNIVFFASRLMAGCAAGNGDPDLSVLQAHDASVSPESAGTGDSADVRPSTDSVTSEPTTIAMPLDTGIDVSFDATLETSVEDAVDSGPCVPTGAEICDSTDNDCNGKIDEIFLCKLGATDGPLCVTSCGSAGQRVCEGPTCTWGVCRPFSEKCDDTIDNDCNGLVDCADPACTSSAECVSKLDAGFVAAGTDAGSCITPIAFSYTGPTSPGSIWVEAWWKVPTGVVRPWGKVTECADVIPGDGKLMCLFNIPCGSASFEFQVYLPDGRYWGDLSFAPTGGKGSTIGTVALSTAKGPLSVTMIPNPKGAPYYNGYVAAIP